MPQRATPLVVMPNPFYQIYEGAALLAGAEPYFMRQRPRATRYLPDLDAVPADVWQRCQVLFLCSPGNPTGAVAEHRLPAARARSSPIATTSSIASDECYSEIYLDEAQPPPGLLQAARRARPHAASSAASSSTACRSVRACRACAPASSPAMPR